jgi:hypothetical protein
MFNGHVFQVSLHSYGYQLCSPSRRLVPLPYEADFIQGLLKKNPKKMQTDLKNMPIKHNKYVVNQKLKYFDDISCRELYSRIFSLTQLRIYHFIHFSLLTVLPFSTTCSFTLRGRLHTGASEEKPKEASLIL